MQHPNVVFVFADQLRYQSCGYAGEGRAKTPNIDSFARESVNFRQCISGSPMCAPYRASLFTGKYSSSTGMVVNELRMNPDHRSLAHVLQSADYDTAYIGKWHLWASEPARHDRDANQYVPPGPYRLGFDGFWRTNNFWHEYYRSFEFWDDPQRIPIAGYQPDAQTDTALRWLEERDPNRPFALFVSYGTPHDPWNEDNVPREFLDLFRDVAFPPPETYADGSAESWAPHLDRQWWLKTVRPNLERWQRIYHAMIANLDGNLGRLLKGLDRLGLSQDSIVVFTSDHGEMFGAHGRIAKNIFYEEAIRVPFLLRWPNRAPSGTTTDVCLNTPDIMPTLLGLLDLPVPPGVEGSDLSHWVLGRPGPAPEEAFLQGMGAVVWWTDGFEWRAVRDGRYTYARMRTDGGEYLFDLVRDPLQTTNLAGSAEHKSMLAHYREALARRMAALGDTFECCTWYRDHWTWNREIVRTATLHSGG